MKYLYGILCILGTILPLSQFVPWVTENGLNILLLFSEANFSKISAFAWIDVIISAVVLIAFILVEGKRQNMTKLWLPILSTCSVGVSLGLPLFLLMKELHIEKMQS